MRNALIFWFFFSAIAWSQTNVPSSCTPSPEIERELLTLELRENLPHLKQQTILEGLLTRHPKNLAVHLRYQDFLRSRQRKDEFQLLVEKYRSLASDDPKNPQSAYLYARALTGIDTPKALQILQAGVAAEPNYSWLHLGLAAIFSLRGDANDTAQGPFTDPDRARREIDSFFASCPDTLNVEAWRLAATNADSSAAEKYAERLRANLRKPMDYGHFDLWPTVWQLELKWSRDPKAARSSLLQDLKRLEGLPGPRDVPRLLAIRDGYKLMGDVESADRVEREVIERWPNDAQVRQIVIDRWWFANQPKDESQAAQTAFAVSYVKMAEEQTRLFPENSRLWSAYLSYLGDLPDASATEIETAGDGLLNAVRIDSMIWRYFSPAEFDVGDAYVKKKVRLETVPSLMEAGIAYRRAHTTVSDLDKKGDYPPEVWDEGLVMDAANLLTRAAQLLNRPEMARDAVNGLDKLTPVDGASRSLIWATRARFAEMQGNKLNALAFFRLAIQEWPAKYEGPDRDELAANEQRLWKELGGTDDGYSAWMMKIGPVESASKQEWAKPPGEMKSWTLPDLEGKQWHESDFHGTVLLVNVWASWCVPCQQELPYLQKLYDRVKDRADVKIVTLNVDEDLGNAVAFVKKNSYTFPVLLAQGHQDELDLNAGKGIPRNWIIDQSGKWIWDHQSDFKVDETLPDRILQQMESVKSN